MARYMIQASYTKEAAAALVKKPEDRSLAVRPLWKSWVVGSSTSTSA